MKPRSHVAGHRALAVPSSPVGRCLRILAATAVLLLASALMGLDGVNIPRVESTGCFTTFFRYHAAGCRTKLIGTAGCWCT